MLENKKAETTLCEPTHYSRLIASWRITGMDYSEAFEAWLNYLGLDKQEISECVELATCGKLEFEVNAWEYSRQYLILHADEYDHAEKESVITRMKKKLKGFFLGA